MNNNCQNKSVKSKNCSSNNEIKLNKFSYADFVLLSSTIAYSLSEELNEADLEIFVAFLGMISSDIAILLIKKGLEKSSAVALEDTVEDSSIDVVDTVQRSSNVKYRKIKKRRKKIRR